MSSLKRNQHLEVKVLWRPNNRLFVASKLVITSPRVGPQDQALFEGYEFADFSYESSAGYLAKRVRNAVMGSTLDPELM